MHRSSLLAALLTLSVSASFAAEVGSISHDQVGSMERRVNSRNYQFFGFGPASLANTGAESGMAYHLAYGMSREVVPHASIRGILQSDFQPKSGAGLAGAGLGVMGFFTTSDISPYLGADLGWGLAWGANPVSQFSWGLSGGVQLFRTSSTQLGVETRLFSLFEKTREGLPMGLSAQLALYY